MKFSVKNCIYIVLFVILQVFFIVQMVNNGTTDILSIISRLALGVISYVGILEILFIFRLTILLPEFYIESCKNICVNSEINKLAVLSIENIASVLKLSVDEFKLLLSIKEEEFHSLVNIKTHATTTKRSIEDKLRRMLDNPFIVTDSRKLKSTSMPEVTNYINFLDVMYNSGLSEDIAFLMCDFIKLMLEPVKLEKILYIIIPYDSNVLFGAGVARILNRKAIKVLKEIPDYHLEKHWEGSIDKFEADNSIIIHDVLYTGRQVVESCKILYKNLHSVEKNDFSNFLFFSLCVVKAFKVPLLGSPSQSRLSFWNVPGRVFLLTQDI